MSTPDPAPAIDSVPDVALLLSYSGDGGVERMMNHLIGGLVAAGCRVDVLVLKASGGHFAGMPDGARVLRLDSSHASAAVGALADYLRRVRPPVLLAAKDRAGRAAVRARVRAQSATRIFIRLGNTLSESLAGRGWLHRTLRVATVRRYWPRADGLIAVSDGVADDVIELARVPSDRVHVAPNPVITPALFERARELPSHAWPDAAGDPVILGVGRLERQKDFPTLLRAFARLRERCSARLVILGEGDDRAALQRLAGELGVADFTSLPGFVDNPHAAMARADLFVLSSAWEGSPNALTEALALGTPVVATDCRSGPREVLDSGRIAPLVPVGDAAALAAAMARILQAPPDADVLRAAVARYERDASTRAYMDILGVVPQGDTAC